MYDRFHDAVESVRSMHLAHGSYPESSHMPNLLHDLTFPIMLSNQVPIKYCQTS